MKVQKSLTALGAALMIISISAPASAFECEGNGNTNDPQTISNNLIVLAESLRCALSDTAPGWHYDPIWQKRGEGSCEVQDSLARKLYEEREFNAGDKPPQKKNNDAAGAAWDVRNAKYLEAIDKLDAFVMDAFRKKLNLWDSSQGGFLNALDAKNYFVTEANTARGCICTLAECEN